MCHLRNQVTAVSCQKPDYLRQVHVNTLAVSLTLMLKINLSLSLLILVPSPPLRSSRVL